MTSGIGKLLSGTGMRQKEKKDLINFTPISQYACTKCVTFKRIVDVKDLQIGDHLCFRSEKFFYHAILIGIKTTDTGVRLNVVCPFRDISKLYKILGKEVSSGNITNTTYIAQELLPEVDVSRIKMYVMQYGRQTYKKEKISQRALAFVQLSDGQSVPLGSLSKQKIRPEAQLRWDTPDITSSHVATWCSTGESFCFDTEYCKKMIEHQEKDQSISMRLTFYKEDDPIEQLTLSHQHHLLCDTCFLSELVHMINGIKNPEKQYKLVSRNIAWTNERKIPRGLYRVKFKVIDDHVIIKINRYSSKHKERASFVKTETFTFTLNKKEKSSHACDLAYRYPNPFSKISEDNDQTF